MVVERNDFFGVTELTYEAEEGILDNREDTELGRSLEGGKVYSSKFLCYVPRLNGRWVAVEGEYLFLTELNRCIINTEQREQYFAVSGIDTTGKVLNRLEWWGERRLF